MDPGCCCLLLLTAWLSGAVVDDDSPAVSDSKQQQQQPGPVNTEAAVQASPAATDVQVDAPRSCFFLRFTLGFWHVSQVYIAVVGVAMQSGWRIML